MKKNESMCEKTCLDKRVNWIYTFQFKMKSCRTITKTGLFALLCIIITSCQDEQLPSLTSNCSTQSCFSITRSTPTPDFNWETADWMPTPAGQSRIPTPWIGQGSISSTWGLDVVNDRKAADGWVLVYSTFDENAPGSLTNPYFILYNKYRGLMRIFLYVTTQFALSSTYIQDGISILSSTPSSMLNFMGEEWIDPKVRKKSYSQIEPAPDDGSLPLASNKWYMLQYELAYDKNLYQQSYNNVQISWCVNYYNITNISLGGDIKGTIKSAVGSSSDNIFSALKNAGTVVGTGAIAAIGQNFLNKNTLDEKTGDNKLGIPKKVFSSVLKGLATSVATGSAGLPGAAMNVFNSIFGGTKDEKMINLTLDAKIKLEGTGTQSGSFPSSPASFWIPGFSFPSSTVGYIPHYNEKLGVLNVDDELQIKLSGYYFSGVYQGTNEEETQAEISFPIIDYSNNLIINPYVQSQAVVKIRKQDLLLVSKYREFDDSKSIFERKEKFGTDNLDCYVNPSKIEWNCLNATAPSVSYKNMFSLAVRFTVDVKPNDGSPVSTITKTFKLTPDYSNVDVEEIDWQSLSNK